MNGSEERKYSDIVCGWLRELGYTHCFFVAGGNIMHLLESASRHFTCVPVVHEVAAGIAAEYFTESGLNGKAFALVTAGPGLTNIVTAAAGAFLESRELLILGGQVKTADLAHGQVRQRGIQEIDGVALMRSITVLAERLDAPWDESAFKARVERGGIGKKGSIFLEFPLDVQARKFSGPVPQAALAPLPASPAPTPIAQALAFITERLLVKKRPVLLLGGGVSRAAAHQAESHVSALGIPVATTWNGADRIGAEHPLYIGRPNTWGQRYANLLLQQADFVIALGTRLGMQQTGFNWQRFAPLAEIAHIDIDPAELGKGHPRTDASFACDAGEVLLALARQRAGDYGEWAEFCRHVKASLPLIEAGNQTGEGFISPYALCAHLAERCTSEDLIVPCSSGSAFTVMMQTFAQKPGQIIVTNKGAASMGYGLSGAIGLSIAGINGKSRGRRTILVEGDGGFSQNLQEVGTVAVRGLPLKMFIFDDHGYASIRMTQRNYFAGNYVGCDFETGLGLPRWEGLFAAYGVACHRLTPDYANDARFTELFDDDAPAAFIVPIDPQQTYFPKIMSRVLPGGGMESNPLHLMSPPLADTQYQDLVRYLAGEER